MRDTKVKAKVKHMCSIRGVLRKDERKGTTSVIPTRGLTEVGHNEFHNLGHGERVPYAVCVELVKVKSKGRPYAVCVESVKKRNDLSQCDKSTNRGLISEDRSTEATLLFTIPRSCLSRLHRIYL